MTLTVKEMQALKILARNHRWALEELVADQKDQEANLLISGNLGGMYDYLRAQFGFGRAVLIQARTLLFYQRDRRKTLRMRSR